MKSVSLHPIVLVIVVSWVLGLAPGSASGQSVAPDSVVARADSLLDAGVPAEAIELVDQILDSASTFRRAHLTRGRALLELRRWGSAADAFEDILQHDSSDILAHYYLARSLRELGTTKAWLLRKADWSRSRKESFWVFRHDSTFRDALYQYALLLDYEGDHPEAIGVGHTQIRIRPDLNDAKLGLYTLYRRFLLIDRSDAIAWFQSQPNSLSRFFLAEAYRREDKLNEAEQILRRMLADASLPLTTPIYLSLAKIAAMRDSLDTSRQYFIDAVNAISSHLAADLVFEDLKYIVSDAELEYYRKLTTPDAKVLFIKAFWDRRDPAAVGSDNSRIGEHYRRLVQAEKDYEYVGFRNSFTNPDEFKELQFPRSYALNQEFNDQGLIFIRHGPPSSVIRSMQMLDAAETWVYSATGREPMRLIHFAKRNTVSNYWRLIPYPKDTALISDLQTYDPRFRDLIGSDISARERMKDDVAAQSQHTVKVALSTEEHTWKPGTTAFEIPVSVDAFRSKDDRALVDISYAIPLGVLASGLPSEESDIPTELALAIRTESGYDLISKRDTLSFARPKSEGGLFISLFRYLLPPGSYAFALHVKPLTGTSFGSWKGTKRIVANSPALSMSDIEFLLPSSATSTLEIDGVKVIPSPLRVYLLNKPLMLYYHAYNLVEDMYGNTATEARYYLTPLSAGSPETAFDPESPPENSTKLEDQRREGKEPTEAKFASLDVRDLSPGRYQVTVVLTDRKQFATIVSSKTINLVSPP
jgi:tetratricopeptide (TPR) repeat protein